MKSARMTVAGLVVGTLVLGAMAAEVRGQQYDIPLKDLRTPATPAFVILGVEPSSVERPLTPRELAVSLASLATDPDFIPSQYALETCPYWLVPHPDLTYEEYYARDPWQSAYRNLSLSVALSKDRREEDTVVESTRLGLGLRTLLYRGQDDPAFLDSLRALQNAMLDADEAGEDTLALRIKELVNGKDNQPFGFTLEVAGAVGLSYPGNETGEGKVDRGGVWLTPGYRPVSDGQIQFLGVLRGLWAEGEKPNCDVGFRFLWFANDRLTISGEYVSRLGPVPDSDGQDTYRAAGIVDYRLSPDLYLTATFGKDYERGGGAGDLLARLGLSLGFGDVPTAAVSPSTGR